MAGEDYSPPSATMGGRATLSNINKVDYAKPIDKKTKSISYSATVHNLLLDLAPTDDSGDDEKHVGTAGISAVRVKNDGYVSALAIFGYTRYTAETTEGNTEYVHYLLAPDEEITIPATRAVIVDSLDHFDGTAVEATAPDGNMYVASGCLLDEGSNITDSVTNFTVDDGDYFHVGDLIRLDNEIMEVTSISTNELYVIRAVHGSTAASHNDDVAIRLPFYNAYHDFDKYSVAQTDSFGRYKATNYAGYGRVAANEGGITAGSIAIQFYEAGYAKLGLTDVTGNTETGLTASTAYEFDITVDGGTTFDNLSFTVDSSNTKFGGSDGVIAKIQDALDAQYYTSGNLFEKKVTVTIENGDVIFRSGSNLSTSAVTLGAGSTGTAEFLGTGRIPAAPTSVSARLAQEKDFDPVTNTGTYNNIFLRDDGRGNLIWKNTQKVGTINYESGAIDFSVSEKPNAEFVVSLLHTSAMSGALSTAGSGRANSLRQVLGNTPQQKCEAILTVETY
tara:strand:+ start:348 stop:1862 length:1515 start_codon:yes stop_codon:yes gene_type:complete